jgi:hypothetical protein
MGCPLYWHEHVGIHCPAEAAAFLRKKRLHPAELSLFARLSIQPRPVDVAEPGRLDESIEAAVPVGGSVALAAARAEQLLRLNKNVQRSRRPSSCSLGFQEGLHTVYRHKLPAPRSRLAEAGPDGWLLFK